MSISATKNNFLLHESNSLNDIMERSPKLFFDDLLIPSLPPQSRNHKVSKAYSYASRSAPATIIGKNNHSNVFQQLPRLPIITKQKSNTAPASPQHLSHYEQNSFITPTSSPGRSNPNLSAQLILTRNHNNQQTNEHLNHFPLPNENYNQMNKNLTLLNQLNESIINSTQNSTNGKRSPVQTLNLPSLKHLKLLPNPNIQENSYIYPDTSEATPYWKRNLVSWCQRESSDTYDRIQDNILFEKNQMNEKFIKFTSNYKNLSESFINEQTNFNEVPSVLKPRDTFQKLTSLNSSNHKVPVTPPMSPKRSSIGMSSNDKTVTNLTDGLKFSPFVSDKLVQLVKDEKKESNQTVTLNNNGHKKTNSFKALQIKNLLDNRDILSKTSKKITKKSGNKQNGKKNSAGRNHFYTSSTLSSPSNNIIGSKAKQLVMKLDQSYNSSGNESDSSSDGSSKRRNSKKTNKSVSRSRSISPVRRKQGSMTPPTPKYHKFSVDSAPQSPAGNSILLPLQQQQHPTTEIKKSPKKTVHHHYHPNRTCLSCHSNDSPCWRPSWSSRKQDQLCNSCGLRYKKTHTRCLNDSCRKIPTKSELNIMKSNGFAQDYVNGLDGLREGYRCLFCNTITETTQA
ncbi:DNA-binding transcription repressor [Maudiozyma exigua]|uniref:DNA-binding transcription repressor n=1 Tax=Maudiozyma exigua TaxID=34358 RepID=A0A9P6WDB5_MAUEX|nr:DNA-binding transcription repressor [Kazachstania exigua]